MVLVPPLTVEFVDETLVTDTPCSPLTLTHLYLVESVESVSV
jgi:hypothetical protein